jgi:two-component system nitrogen regulation response regulator GlnG
MHETRNSVIIGNERHDSDRAVTDVADIMIIERDELMRSLLSDCLTEAGYRVRTPDPQEPTAQPLSLLIIDVYMPRSIGVELLRKLKAAHPQTPIIAISGQFCSGSLSCAEELGVKRVIPKPFRRDELLDAVRGLIGPPA